MPKYCLLDILKMFPKSGSYIFILLCCLLVTSVMFDSVPRCGRQPTRLLCPWDSPSKNTGVGCHFLHRRVFPNPEIEPASPALAGYSALNWICNSALADSLPLSHQEAQVYVSIYVFCADLPRMPRCSSSGPLSFWLEKEASVYSR